MGEQLRLWYQAPAGRFTEALPLGNGRLGAMWYGGVAEERIGLNEDALWSGGPKDFTTPGAREALAQVREALRREDYPAAYTLSKQLQGPYTQSFLPMGDLRVQVAHGGEAADYTRALDLQQAVASVQYRVGEVVFRRECFVSAPHQALVLRLTASQPGQLTCTACLESPLPAEQSACGPDGLALTGKAYAHVDPIYYDRNLIQYEEGPDGEGVAFAVRLRAVAVNGHVWSDADGVHIADADEVLFLLTSATGFRDFACPARDGRDARALAEEAMCAITDTPYAALRAVHVQDYAALFTRCTLDLGAGEDALLPTDTRLRRFTGDNDLSLVTLLFQYGRYLLIASSRPGTQPANAQGIWNDQVRPPWCSNYTININTEMNYWLAEPTNLNECHHPLFDLIDALTVTGATIAQQNYGCRGWVAHHNTDVWALANAVGEYGIGDPLWSCWPMGGAWLCQHLWEHYAFTRDVALLRRAWPALHGAATFLLDWLTPFTTNGQEYLVTMPATTPENGFVTPEGVASAVSIATTMDMAITRDLFTNVLAAAQALGVDDEAFCARVRDARARLLPYQIGQYGQLQEWYQDWDNPDDHHRHVSHLFGLHPGNQITSTDTPALFEAARRTLELRGDEGTGWSVAWKINFWARLLDGDHSWQMINMMLRLVEISETIYCEGGGVYANLLDAHPPFQIDGNFGATAGITEMLMQSHQVLDPGSADPQYLIHLLPALPAAWPQGSLTGICARGGFEIDLQWQQHTLTQAIIHSKAGLPCRLLTAQPLTVTCQGVPVPTRMIRGDVLEFATVAQGVYIIQPDG